jgi:hypothetical protein
MLPSRPSKKGNVPKQKFPDFLCAFSSINTLLSGNESDKLEAGVENIEGIIDVVNENEQLAASNLSDPVQEMTELDYMLENIDGEAIDGEEAIANNAAFENFVGQYEDLQTCQIEGFVQGYQHQHSFHRQ